MSEAFYTIKELAEHLRMTTHTIYKLARLGEIPGRRVGGGWRFPVKATEAWLQNDKAYRQSVGELPLPTGVKVITEDKQ